MPSVGQISFWKYGTSPQNNYNLDNVCQCFVQVFKCSKSYVQLSNDWTVYFQLSNRWTVYVQLSDNWTVHIQLSDGSTVCVQLSIGQLQTFLTPGRHNRMFVCLRHWVHFFCGLLLTLKSLVERFSVSRMEDFFLSGNYSKQFNNNIIKHDQGYGRNIHTSNFNSSSCLYPCLCPWLFPCCGYIWELIKFITIGTN